MSKAIDGSGLIITGGKKFAALPFLAELKTVFSCVVAHSPHDLQKINPSIIVLDAELLARDAIDVWRQCAPNAILIAEEHVTDNADLYLPIGMPQKITLATLRQACEQWVLRRQIAQLNQTITDGHQQLLQLTHIGIALSSEKNLHRLLELILEEGTKLACCDAASMFLIDRRDMQNPQLTFKLTRNDSISFPFEEKQFPLSMKSLAGYVALTGEELNIVDAYQLPSNTPYSFNRSFDEAMNYHTVNMLVLPMRNYRSEVIGVLQFINRKKQHDVILSSADVALTNTVAFDENIAELLRALASQAAVAIENDVLLEQIKHLFDGFVIAAVHAIEQRDPTTSGHSFRVADLTTQLAVNLSRSNKTVFHNVVFSEDDIREIRFASLLHDFGKVGVREHVLVKEKKLPAHRLDLIRHRIELEKERIQRIRFEQEVFLLKNYPEQYAQKSAQLITQTLHKTERLNQLLGVVIDANEPSILPADAHGSLEELHSYEYQHVDGTLGRLVDQDELLALSVRKGSLTEAERKEIESHVVHTLEFLKLIPWTPELSRVPQIAGSHHEKLNGKGYPEGLTNEQIPLPSKLMTISDIYDALTASDRPYKSALPVEKALNILEMEAKAGMLYQDAVDVFIESKAYQVINPTDYKSVLGNNQQQGYAHHVCDQDVHPHK